MSTKAEHHDGRRRSPLFVLLLVTAVLSGLLAGQLLYGGDDSDAEPARAAQRPDVAVVQPTAEPASRPGAVVVTGTGQSSGVGAGRAGSGTTLDVTTVVVGELAPGHPAAIVLTLRNTGDRSVVVTGASAAVTDVDGAGLAGVPACVVSWFSVAGFAGTATVPAEGTHRLQLPLTLLDSPTVNQDDCKQARFSYAYQVRAARS